MRLSPLAFAAASALALFSSGASAFIGYLDFLECRNKVDKIVNRGERIDGIDNRTLEALGYRYHGDIPRLKPPNSSEDTLALTYAGLSHAALQCTAGTHADIMSLSQAAWRCAEREPVTLTLTRRSS
jgi:hypothetical protein